MRTTKKLFSLINTLHEAMLAGKGSEKIKQVVSELSNYTKFHFSTEKALLEKTKYGALTAHRPQHHAFVKKVEDFQKDVAAGKTANSASALNFMKDWFDQAHQTDRSEVCRTPERKPGALKKARSGVSSATVGLITAL